MFTHDAIDRIEASLADLDSNPRALLDAVKAESARDLRVTSYGVYSLIWCAGMTLAFGPTGLHPSRADANGYPTPETMAEFPSIGWGMADARRRVVECYIPCARREARASDGAEIGGAS